ncbi:hypothetical protein EJ07DRAFT_156356 [Lizonia empirigonia]|nr:hypothetical protein EJ07DRAFT_156356 [Lizonia empirigonia]
MAQTRKPACTTEVDEPIPASFRSNHHRNGKWSPSNRNLEFAGAGGAAPPATIPPATINTDTELLALKDSVATYPPRNHVHRRPASDTAADLNSSTGPPRSTTAFALPSPTSETPLVRAALSDDSSPRTVASGLLVPARECSMCGEKFDRQHLFDFHQEKHTRHIGSVSSSAASHASSKTCVQETWDKFPRSPTLDVTQQSRKVADTSLFAEVQDVLWIEHVEATPQGVYGIRVLVRTFYGTVQLMPMVKSVMESHGFDLAAYMHKEGFSIPPRTIWASHLQLEDLVSEEDDRRLLESGQGCSLVCVPLALHEKSDNSFEPFLSVAM